MRFFGHYLWKIDIIFQILDIIVVILGDIICPTSKSQGCEMLSGQIEEEEDDLSNGEAEAEYNNENDAMVNNSNDNQR